jgi:hypothetical protein
MVKPIPPLNVSDSWPAVNYVNPEIRSHGALLAITVVFTTVMVLIISMRLYVRLFVLRTPGWDDLFILIAAVSTFPVPSQNHSHRYRSFLLAYV